MGLTLPHPRAAPRQSHARCRMNPLFLGCVTNIKVRLLHKCLINCSSGLRDLNRNATLHKSTTTDGGRAPTPSTGGRGVTPSTGGRGVTPSTGGRGVTPSTGGRAQDPGAVLPNLGAGLVISYLRPSGRVRARSSSRVYARYNSVRLLGRTTRRPAPSSYDCPVRHRAALFVSAARLANVPVLCARRAISSQSSAQGQVNRSVHHHHRSESREVF